MQKERKPKIPRVLIFKDVNGNMKFLPDYLVLSKYDGEDVLVKFQAVNLDVAIIIPRLEFSDIADKKKGKVFTLDAANERKKVMKLVESRGVESGEYPYTIYSLDTNECIVGNSPPSMVIVKESETEGIPE